MKINMNNSRLDNITQIKKNLKDRDKILFNIALKKIQ